MAKRKGDREKRRTKKRRNKTRWRKRLKNVCYQPRPRSGLLRVAASIASNTLRSSSSSTPSLLSRSSAVNRFFLCRLVVKNEEKRGDWPRAPSTPLLLLVESPITRKLDAFLQFRYPDVLWQIYVLVFFFLNNILYSIFYEFLHLIA